MDTGGGQMGNMDLNKVIGRSNLATLGRGNPMSESRGRSSS